MAQSEVQPTVARSEKLPTVLIVEKPRSTRGGPLRRYSDEEYVRQLKQYYDGDIAITRTTAIEEAMRFLQKEHFDFVVGMTAPAIAREIHRLLNLATASVEYGAVFLLLEERIDSRLPNWELSVALLLLSPTETLRRSRLVP